MTAKLMNLEDLFVDQLRDVLYAERQITRALPKMARGASSTDLAQALTAHLKETEGQIDRLEKVFEELDLTARGKKCEAILGLIEEGQSLMEEEAEPEVLDAGIIASAQKVEHYEIAAYGCLVTWAEQLGHAKAAKLLQQILDEEKAADVKLSGLAETVVNLEAAAPVGSSQG
ncbi:MAG: ferritin-like domain-containing protein [Actinomycetota bacterium]